MDLSEHLRILRTHQWWIISFCVSATLATFGLTYAVSNKYVATALVLVKPYANNTISNKNTAKEQLLNFPVGGGLPKAEIPSNTYIEIIRSRIIAEKVVRLLGLDSQTEIRPSSGSLKDELRYYFMKKLRDFKFFVIPLLKYGQVMDSPPPLEIAVDNYEHAISLNPIKDAYQFKITYEADEPTQAAVVANATADLFVEFMAQMNMSDVNSSLAFLAERLTESEKKLVVATEALRTFKEANKTIAYKEETESKINLVAELETTLEKTEARLAGLLQQYTPQNLKVLAVQAEKNRLLHALEQRKKGLDLLPKIEKQLENLKLNVRVADEIYQLVEKEYEDVKLRTSVRAGEVRVVSRAIPTYYPSKPIKAKYSLVAFGIALFMGVLLAYIIEYSRNTIYSIEQAERALGMRVLATLPENRSLIQK